MPNPTPVPARVTIIGAGSVWQVYCVCGWESESPVAGGALNAAYHHYVESDVHDHSLTRLFIDLGPVHAISNT